MTPQKKNGASPKQTATVMKINFDFIFFIKLWRWYLTVLDLVYLDVCIVMVQFILTFQIPFCHVTSRDSTVYETWAL